MYACPWRTTIRYWGAERAAYSRFHPGPLVRRRYPLRRFGGDSAVAFVRANADYNVVCPVMRLAKRVATAGRSTSSAAALEDLAVGDIVAL